MKHLDENVSEDITHGGATATEKLWVSTVSLDLALVSLSQRQPKQSHTNGY